MPKNGEKPSQKKLETMKNLFIYFRNNACERTLLSVPFQLQYMFIYNAVLESVLCGTTEINTCDFPLKIKHLNNLNPTSSCTYMQEEYDVRIQSLFKVSGQTVFYFGIP